MIKTPPLFEKSAQGISPPGSKAGVWGGGEGHGQRTWRGRNLKFIKKTGFPHGLRKKIEKKKKTGPVYEPSDKSKKKTTKRGIHKPRRGGFHKYQT